ncbi:MAG TPA: EVE domain-containing protein [Thermoplasmata archaeon]|nr:EVE domain-containing protein [Thermoplasmata archaeon]
MGRGPVRAPGQDRPDAGVRPRPRTPPVRHRSPRRRGRLTEAPPPVSHPARPSNVAHWLVKQEPSSYSYPDLEREGRTRWDGVHNALALQHLRAMRPGDEAYFYHSGEERACVGVLRVTSLPHPDDDDPRRSWWFEVKPVRRLPRPVPLGEIRADPAFAGFELLRMSRLSVLPVPDPMWDRIGWLSARPAASPTAIAKGRVRGPAPPRRRAPVRRRR